LLTVSTGSQTMRLTGLGNARIGKDGFLSFRIAPNAPDGIWNFEGRITNGVMSGTHAMAFGTSGRVSGSWTATRR
jgi:hypothetical protein